MDMKDLQNKNEGELHKLLAEERTKLRDLRFQVSSEQHKQVHNVRVVRKSIARIMTLLHKGHTVAKQVTNKIAPSLASKKESK